MIDKMRHTLIVLLLLCPLISFAQDEVRVQLDLAEQFFRDKEYEKSLELYEEVFKKKQDKEIYFSLINAYIAAGRPEGAESTIKKQLRKSPSDPDYQVDYGYVLALTGEAKKSEEVYRDAIKSLPPQTNAILGLSTSFQRRNEISYAIDCLQKGKKLTGGMYGFEFELGELYYQMGNYSAMIDEYLDLLDKNEGYLQNVQNALNTSIYSDPKKEHLDLLNQALLRRIQKNPDKMVFSEMLIWFYMQQKDFKGAIVQTRAIDKRNNENGYRFIALGKTCLSNREYDLAMECYQILIDKGPSSQHYVNARILMTEAIREKITSSPYTRHPFSFLIIVALAFSLSFL